ncbi:enoyl-CoA hydratase/isomerase family protein [Streptomyces hirsutus]|uniref:enoyl-CoA hydratase/isomerase family protein n=1 Tax=Streptomyces hirsutus TaxID=35620 RepID=UPI00343AE4E6
MGSHSDGESDDVLLSIEDAVATLTLNRPERLNALRLETFQQLRRHLETLETHPDVSCVVLAGAGRAFCAGNDLESLRDGEAKEERFFKAGTLDLLERFTYPVIAKVHGYCLTGALELVLASDFVIAGETAQFGDTHAKLGLTPVWGMSVRLPERVGAARAKELSFTARRIDGREAARIGLVEYVVPDADLDRATAEVARHVAANSKHSNAMFKALVAGSAPDSGGRQDRLDRERGLPFGIPADFQERLAAFG